MKFAFVFNASQTQDREHKQKEEEVVVETQRAAPQGFSKTKAVEENEHVILSDQKKFDCFYDFITFAFSFNASQTQEGEPKDKDKKGKVKTQRAAPQEPGKTKAAEKMSK